MRRFYIVTGLRSFNASAECADRKRDVPAAKFGMADEWRAEKTIRH